MRLPPIEVLLTWPTPNYTNPPTRGAAVLVVSIVCLVFSTIITGLRLYTRLRITRTAGLDDVLIVFGLAFAIGMAVVVSLATEQHGWNRHIWDVPLDWLPTVSKMNLTFQIFFSLSCSVTKFSLLWFCRRLFNTGTYSFYNISMIVGMVVVFLSSALFILFSIFQCLPIHAYWDLEPQYPHRCLNDGAIVFSASVINIFTDVLTTILPMPLIWSLRMPTRQRIAVISIFGLGIVVDVAGAIRTVYVWKSMIASYDTTWEGWPILLAATIEINLGLICASAPALRPLLTFFLPRLFGSSYRYGSDHGNSTPKHSWKLGFSNSNISKKSRNSRHHSAHGELPTERLEVFRSVEMKTHTENHSSQQIGHGFAVSADEPHSHAHARKHPDQIRLTSVSEGEEYSSSERSLSPPLRMGSKSDVGGLPPSRENESV